MSELRRTPLYDEHRALGARLVEFAGFEMPIQYSSILVEHTAVRERAGLFDVSHMGQIHLSGPEAVASVQRLVTCPVAKLAVGAIRYGLLCNEEGGVVDDVTVYRTAADAFFLCVNAANIEKDDAWIRGHASAPVDNRSDATGMLALQGPASEAILEAAGVKEALSLSRFRFDQFTIAGVPTLVSRTGYTGSAGFELYAPAESIAAIFRQLLHVGDSEGLVPVGLGARDTLRLEAALPLYGHELDDTTSPLEAGLERFVKRKAGGFIGAEAIERRAADGHCRRLVGFVMEGRGIARADHEITSRGEIIGRVTSGAPSPTLGKSIGLGYVSPEHAEPESALDIVIRGKPIAARVVETPFV